MVESKIVVKLEPAVKSHSDAKYVVKVDKKHVSFGLRGASDFTQH